LLYLQDCFRFKHATGIDLGFTGVTGHKNARFLPANLNQPWPLEDRSTDVLIAMMLIEHLFDPFFSFRDIGRTLSSDGRAFVNLPLVTGIKNRLRLLAGKLPTTSVPYRRWQQEGDWDGFHLHYSSIHAIIDFACQACLRVVSFSSAGRLASLKDTRQSLFCDEISFELRKVKLI